MAKNNSFWAKVYTDYAPKMLGICRRYVTDNNLAEDLMHEAFLQAIEKYHSYKGTGAFGGWLARITINTALMYIRKSKQLSVLQFDSASLTAYDSSLPDTDIDESNQMEFIKKSDFALDDLLKVLDELQEHHRTVFNLYVMDGYTHNKIGDLLGISPGTSKSHLSRARKRIQAILYQKALDMKRKRKRASALIPFIAGRPNPIDTLYQKAFKNYSIPTGNIPIEVINSIGSSSASATNFFGSIISGTKMAVLCTASIVGVGSVIFFTSTGVSLDQPEISHHTAPDTTRKPAVEPEFIKEETSNEHLEETNKNQIDSNNHNTPTPVVVRRQVIVRDTVYQYIDDNE